MGVPTVQPDNPATQINGAKVIEQGSKLRLLVPGVETTDTVGLRYVPVAIANPWSVKPVEYGIATHREGDVFTIENYSVVPAGTYHLLIVDSKLRHAVLTATISEK